MFVSNYNRDHYYDAKMVKEILEWDTMVKDFCRIITEYANNVDTPVSDLECIKKHLKTLEKYHSHHLYREMTFFLQHHQKLEGNDRLRNMCDRVKRLQKISDEDNAAYDTFMAELVGDIFSAPPSIAPLIIGGHQHQHYADDYSIHVEVSEPGKSKKWETHSIPVHECAGLYCKPTTAGSATSSANEKLYYSIIEFGSDGLHKIVHYNRDSAGPTPTITPDATTTAPPFKDTEKYKDRFPSSRYP
jgi:hypothetical protein